MMRRWLLAPLAALALWACLSLPRLDVGMLTARDGGELHLVSTPWVVQFDPALLHDVDLEGDLEWAVGWWREELMVHGIWRDLVATRGESRQVALVSVRRVVDDAPVDEPSRALAWTTLHVDQHGAVHGADLVLSRDYVYHRPTVRRALRHEIGHLLLLADDPHSLDTHSVMGWPLAEPVYLTGHDAALIRAYIGDD